MWPVSLRTSLALDCETVGRDLHETHGGQLANISYSVLILARRTLKHFLTRSSNARGLLGVGATQAHSRSQYTCVGQCKFYSD